MKTFSRPQASIVILLSLLLVSFYGWRHYSLHRQASIPTQIFPVNVVVQVDGKVRTPGIYSFDQPVTVSDAVARAGGVVPPLKLAPRWQEMRVAHTSRLHIVAEGNNVARVRTGRMSVPSRIVLGVFLDANHASEAELAMVPGITQLLAERIVAQRQRRGGFSKLEDLLTVKGIGPVTLKRLQEYLTIGTVGRRGKGEKGRGGGSAKASGEM